MLLIHDLLIQINRSKHFWVAPDEAEETTNRSHKKVGAFNTLRDGAPNEETPEKGVWDRVHN